MNYDEVYAVPNSRHVIDFIRPDGLTCVNGHTKEQVLARYPDAVRMTFDDWRQREGDRQHVPFTWEPTTEEKYVEMLEVLPPACMKNGAFLVGEPTTHSVRNGEPMYAAYRFRDGVYECASRALTPKEFREAIR